MKRLYLPLLLFFLLTFEGVVPDLLPFQSPSTIIVPHFVLVLLVLITVFYDKENTYAAVLYSIIFGLLIDVVYTGVLGVYMFGYGIVIYAIHKLKVLVHANFYVVTLLGFLSVALAEVFIYIVYLTIGITTVGWGDYLYYRLLPTVLANFLFFIVLYPIIANKLAIWSKEQTSKKYYL